MNGQPLSTAEIEDGISLAADLPAGLFLANRVYQAGCYWTVNCNEGNFAYIYKSPSGVSSVNGVCLRHLEFIAHAANNYCDALTQLKELQEEAEIVAHYRETIRAKDELIALLQRRLTALGNELASREALAPLG